MRRIHSMALVASFLPAMGLQAQLTVPDRDQFISPDLPVVFQVGALDGEDWENFGRVRDAGFDAAGNLYVLDSQASRISVFDSTGQYVRHFGKAGEGPGEFQQPVAFAVLPDGTSVVTDARARAIMFFSSSGQFMYQNSIEGGNVQAGALEPDPRGGGIFEGGVRMRSFMGPGSMDAPTGRPINRFTASQGAERSLFHTAWQVQAGDPGEAFQSSGGGTTVSLSRLSGLLPKVWEPGLHWGPLPDGGVALVDSTTWKVKLVGPSGRLRSVIERPSLRPVAVTPAIQEANEAREQAEQEASGTGTGAVRVVGGSGGGAAQSFSLGPQEYYHEIPVISGMAVSPTGLLWIERGLEFRSAPGPIDLVRWDGRYLGTVAAGEVELPEAFGPNGLAAWIERDDFDVPHVVVRRLPAELR